ncbi:hypothetical protein D3C83_295390 [compost metagenome]
MQDFLEQLGLDVDVLLLADTLLQEPAAGRQGKPGDDQGTQYGFLVDHPASRFPWLARQNGGEPLWGY